MVNDMPMPLAIADTLATQGVPQSISKPDIRIGFQIDESIVWPWVQDIFYNQRQYFAEKIECPELLQMDLSRFTPPIKLQKLTDVYQEKNPSTKKTKDRTVNCFKALMKATGAKTLPELSQEKLMAWRDSIEQSETIKSAGSKKALYGQIKTLISFGLKAGLDKTQIAAALASCKVLWTADVESPMQPHPIDRADFHTLLKTAAGGMWRAYLLLGLNLCMTLGELIELVPSDFDLENGTFTCIRHKTRHMRIPRAATLWAETIEAVRPLIRSDRKYIFTSPRGCKYSSTSRHDEFAKLRDKAKLPDDVKYSHIRDGAYTVACNEGKSTESERLSKVFAGHEAGMSDAYVRRNPAIVKPVCDAVYAKYGPFPKPKMPGDENWV